MKFVKQLGAPRSRRAFSALACERFLDLKFRIARGPDIKFPHGGRWPRAFSQISSGVAVAGMIPDAKAIWRGCVPAQDVEIAVICTDFHESHQLQVV